MKNQNVCWTKQFTTQKQFIWVLGKKTTHNVQATGRITTMELQQMFSTTQYSSTST